MEIQAVEKAVDAGVAVCISAGNSTNSGYMSIDNGIVGSPSVAKSSISVASSENTNIIYPVFRYTSGQTRGEIKYGIAEVNPQGRLRGEVINCGEGTVEDFDGKDVRDKIVLVGTREYDEVVLRAQDLGAKGIIIYNGKDIPSKPSNIDIAIPVALISQADGEKLKNLENLHVRFGRKTSTDENGKNGQLSSFSSWGPTPNLNFKPDITAPGGQIWSTTNDNGYRNMSGTSMAAPHLSGSMALILQHINTMNLNLEGREKIEFAKALAMNTSNPVIYNGKYFSTRVQGAGLIDVSRAIKNDVTVTSEETGYPAVALKSFNENQKQFTIDITNYSDEERKYSIKDVSGVLTNASTEIFQDTMQNLMSIIISNASLHMALDVDLPGGAVNFSEKDIVIPAGGKKQVTVTIELPENTTKNRYIEGYLKFISLDENGQDIGIPYMGFYGEWNEIPIFEAPIWENQDEYIGTKMYSIDKNGGEPILLGTNKEGLIEKENIAISSKNGELDIFPYAFMCRNAKEVFIDILDENENVLQTIKTDHNITKDTSSDILSSILSGKDEFIKSKLNWKFDLNVYDSQSGEYKKLKDGQYTYQIRAKIDYPDAEYQTFKIPFKIDSVNPVITNASIVKGEAENQVLKINAQDNFSGISAFMIQINGEYYNNPKGDKVWKVEKNEEGNYELPIQTNVGDRIKIYALDNAKNVSIFNLQNAEEHIAHKFRVEIDGLPTQSYYNVSSKILTGRVNKPVRALTINGQEIQVNEDLTFEYTMNLDNGRNEIAVKATSEDGEIADYRYHIYADIVKPTITLNQEGTIYVSEDTGIYTVEGEAGDNKYGYTIYVNENAVGKTIEQASVGTTPPSMHFEKEIQLVNDETNIRIRVTDIAGNETVKNIKVVKDDSRVNTNTVINNDLDIQFITPQNGLDIVSAAQNEYELSFRVKTGSTVEINGKQIDVNDEVINEAVELTQGMNKIVINVTNNEGNITTKNVFVYRIK